MKISPLVILAVLTLSGCPSGPAGPAPATPSATPSTVPSQTPASPVPAAGLTVTGEGGSNVTNRTLTRTGGDTADGIVASGGLLVAWSSSDVSPAYLFRFGIAATAEPGKTYPVKPVAAVNTGNVNLDYSEVGGGVARVWRGTGGSVTVEALSADSVTIRFNDVTLGLEEQSSAQGTLKLTGSATFKVTKQ